ncbi:drug/metabolite transporter (DMT)-like permease [Hamadaea flava]|uniref:DMT family transporter n=1 Tax=Hamadaea flava TaxID=1742688 RepID=A0ABV8LXX9_9ACTN|nr:DMT family transporter [Hamadaea flava]MCP2328877.1 drug/metabolite transporter (DMT)-like permease [Hamadaea flava]
MVATARILILAVLWGSGFLWIKLALRGGLTPAQLTFGRAAAGAAFLLVLALLARQRLPRDVVTWRRLGLAALLCNALPFFLFGLGERTVSSGTAGVLNATTPLWSVLLGSERGLRPVRLTGLLLGFGGVLVIFEPWRDGGLRTWGAVALLGAAASYAVAFAYMERRLTGRAAPLALSAAQLGTAAVWTVPALPFGDPGTPTLAGLAAVVVLGVFATGLTFHLSFRLIADEGATSAATVGYLLPVVSVTLGAVFLGESLTPRVLLGMAVVLGGVALTRLTPRPAPAAPSPVASSATTAATE